MLNKLALKIGLLFFIIIVIIESFLFIILYNTFVHERVDEVMATLLARGDTHSEVLENNFEPNTLHHISIMETASEFNIIVVDETGRQLTHSDSIEPEMNEMIEHTETDVIPLSGKIIEDRWYEKKFIGADSPITIEGEHRGHVFMFAETTQIRDMVNHLRNQFLAAGLISFALTIIAIFLLSRFITLPLIRIKEAANQIIQGNNQVKLNINRNDELGELANAITTLSNDLNRLKNARNEFLANISHELRTPLTYIKGYADIISRSHTSEEEKREYVAIIREETTNLTELIRHLFELARVDHNQFSVKKETVTLEQLLQSVALLVRPAFDEKNMSLFVQCDERIDVFIDRKIFNQLLLNILDNARKYSLEGTQVILQGLQDEDLIKIVIIDEGEGIPEEDIPFVFERLYRVDKSRSRQFGGSGLGLAIAKELIELHDGRITLQSSFGKGTTVLIELKKEDAPVGSSVEAG
ncbi:HAMP domain-containing sensor histidine kinase [Planococcus sp. N028]|uniref:histidine kinase n=1 Tax=Planococcus shixiaomingii TaxID=3058393 RepID=A0ABT8N4F5_9BACL|nr:HAMP domain-containing sensor histidine kinase [Planococcus sp. N028]MDN7242763.1 HAMP domain-containing sensor histidine kinase [Planococcus sp. N028]